ncbi:MAG: uroporphyrinogen decarboxylase family protein [bacterium]
MTNRERFIAALKCEAIDRLPVIEPFVWWNLTIDRWHGEGLPAEILDPTEFFGLDPWHQTWIGPGPEKNPESDDGDWKIENIDDYIRAKRHLFPEPPFNYEKVDRQIQRHLSGEIYAWITVEGFFWFPRVILGIENHLYSYCTNPELIHAINRDLLEFNKCAITEYCHHLTPDWMTIAEDMSYNAGSMIGKNLVDEFMRPYYLELIAHAKNCGIRFVFVDTDGNCTDPISWFHDETGIDGFVPFERNAGMDLNVTRERHPKVLIIGGFDKRKMYASESELRLEFETALPALRQGGIILGCDHQTPPEVSLERYKLYVKLLGEYAHLAVK